MSDPTDPPGHADVLAEHRELFFAARNLAPLTRRDYAGDLAELAAFLAERHGDELTVDRITRQHLTAYLAHLDRRGLKGTSRARKVATLRSFFGFLTTEGILATNPAAELIPPEREHPQPRVLSEAEYQRLREAVRGQVRDGAIIELLLQTGMRLSELTRLKVSDLQIPAKIAPPNKARNDPGTLGAVAIHGKGRKDRTVTLNWKACRAVRSYLQVRSRLDPTEAEPILFLTKFARPMSTRAIQRVIEKYVDEAGIRDASVHALRHTFATQHVKAGTSLASVRAALGHESLATTSIYVGLAREQMDRELQEHAL